MEFGDDNLFRRVHALAARQLETELAPAERQELDALLLESADARRVYAEYLQETAGLRWLCHDEFSTRAEQVTYLRNQPEAQAHRSRARTFALVMAMACALAIVGFVWLLNVVPKNVAVAIDSGTPPTTADQATETPISHGDEIAILPPEDAEPPAGAESVATITGLGSARWSHLDGEGHVLSRCYVGEHRHLREGMAQLTFDAGAQVTVFAPAEFEITSPTSIRWVYGRVTTLVTEQGRGFTIETPQGKVVDLGTQFGLDVSEKGETQVVVFQGSVDVEPRQSVKTGDADIRRLKQGEALLLKQSGEFQRVISFPRNQFMAAIEEISRRPRPPVIADVRDNIRSAQNLKSYQIVHAGLFEDAICFVDRNHQWNGLDAAGLPEFLQGADYIMPFNDDKFVRDLELTVQLDRPAHLYVFLDNNMQVPDWLKKDFVDTGVDIGLDGAPTEWHPTHSLAVNAGKSIDFVFSVWRREIKQAGTIKLGGVEPPEIRSQGFSMYGIAAVAAE